MKNDQTLSRRPKDSSVENEGPINFTVFYPSPLYRTFSRIVLLFCMYTFPLQNILKNSFAFLYVYTFPLQNILKNCIAILYVHFPFTEHSQELFCFSLCTLSLYRTFSRIVLLFCMYTFPLQNTLKNCIAIHYIHFPFTTYSHELCYYSLCNN